MKKRRNLLIVSIIAAVITVATVIGLFTILKDRKLDKEQEAFVEELQTKAGSYDEHSIVLADTNQYEAEKLAEKFGARLRISQDGKFAVLYLPDDKSIVDISSDKANKKYIGLMTPDYHARISEVGETEEETYIHAARQPDYEVNDEYYVYQNYINYLNLGSVWQISKGAELTVAVIDTGIDTDHPEFEGRISEWSYNATYDKIVKDYDNDWSLIEDNAGHGTSVTGVIAAAMDDKGITGIAPEVKILVIKAECNENGEFYRVSDLVFGLYYAIERDVDVVNMSFTVGPPNPFGDALELAVDSDIICVAAAGNKSSAMNKYPAADVNCIGVGALEEGGWERASYSNYGDNTEVFAPGTVFTTAVGGVYKYISGTSFSSPSVAAAAVLYKSAFGKYITNENFIQRLHASCYDLGVPGPDFFYGYGALDVDALICEPDGKATFNMMTDELDDEERIFIRNHPIQDVPEPERLYAVFDGWYYDPQYTDEMNWYEDSYNADVTLYAKWANEDDTIPFEYRILDDGTVEILKYRGKRRFITIPDYIEGRQVSSIGFRSFNGESRLRRIILPHYLKNIEAEAFAGCTNIISFSLPDGVENIGEKAFKDNVRLNMLSLGSSLRCVGDYAFENCGLLTSLYFPETLSSINGTAFAGTVSMTSILVDEGCDGFISVNGVLYNHSKSVIVAYPAARTEYYALFDETTTVGVAAFHSTAASNVDLNAVKYIEDIAFLCGGIAKVIIPDTCLMLGEGAFAECPSLKYARIGSSVTELSASVFCKCTSLEEIYIGKGITTIKEAAFAEDESLETATFEEGSKLTIIGKQAFYKTGLTSINIPQSVVYVKDAAFSKCSDLASVTFEESSDLLSIGSEAFSESTSLRRISFPNKLRSIGDYCFKSSDLRDEVIIPASVTNFGAGTFAACRKLQYIRIEKENEIYKDIDGVVYTLDEEVLIEYPAGSRRTYYNIPDSVKDIYVAAFYGSWYLDSITMADSVINANGYAFYDCKFMTDYTLSQNLIYLGEYAFSKNLSLRYMYIPDSVRQISRFCFAEDWLLAEVFISDSTHMTRIGFQAFGYCGLQSFRVPANVSSVAQYAFEGCVRLREFTFAANSKLESISAYFFLGCDSITRVVFEPGSALKSIQAHGFHGMTELYTVDFGDAALENIDNYAFRMCPCLAELNIPDTVKNIGRFAFYRCDSLTSLILPEGLEHIGEYAFFATKNLDVYFKSEFLPIYLDENWDNGLRGYYTGVTAVVESGDWQYANLKNGTVSIIKYSGDAESVDLSAFEHGNVSVIGGYAFADKKIKSVILPDSLEQIQRYAFVGNTELQSLTIPENVSFIAQHAFEKTGIQTLTFKGNKIKVIEQYAFAYTRELKSVVLPGSLEKLGTYAFYVSGIETLGFGEGYCLDTIPEGCFAETKLKTVKIPDYTKVIDHNAFSHNHELKSVDLGAGGDLMIMSNVFYNTGLTSVHISANVGFIGEYAFMDLDDLTAFTVDGDNPYYSAIDGVLYNKDGTKLISMPAGRTGSYVIPKEVVILGFGAFENSKLSEITVEEGSRLVTFGYRAFYSAKNLTSFTVPKGVVSIDYYAFAECDKLKTVVFEGGNRMSGIYEGAFFGCRSLENIVLPDTVVEISDYAFYACESLDVLPLSKTTGVLGIYDYAFAYTGITDLDLSPEIVDIGSFAFRNIRIKELVIEPTDYRQLRIGYGAFADCDMLESVTVPFTGKEYNSQKHYWFGYIFGSGKPEFDNEFIPASLKSITVTVQKVYNEVNKMTNLLMYSFYRYGNVETVVLPEDTTFIGPETFKEFLSLKSFDYPNDISKIERSTFESCKSLAEFYMPDAVDNVSAGAFAYCEKLTSLRLSDNLMTIESATIFDPGAFEGCAIYAVDLPESLTLLGNKAFIGCQNITEIYVADTVTVGGGVFANCTSLKTADVRSASVGDSMFANCVSLESVYASPTVNEIGGSAFENCEKLMTFEIPSNVKGIGANAFRDCYAFSYDLAFDRLEYLGESAFSYSGITGITLPGTLKDFGCYAFLCCSELKRAKLCEGITVIPYATFENCSMLEELELPDTMKEINGSAFANCVKIVTFTIPKNVYKIESDILCGTNLEYLCIGEGVRIIDDYAFHGMFIWCIENRSSLPIELNKDTYGMVAAKSMVLIDKDGYHFTEIYDQSFVVSEDGFIFEVYRDWVILHGYLGGEKTITLPADYQGQEYILDSFRAPFTEHIIVPEGTKTLRDCGFASYALEKVTLPKSLEEIDARTFVTAMNLSDIVIAEGNEHLSFEDRVLYCDDRAVFVPNDFSGVITIREGTKSIDPGFTSKFVLIPYSTYTSSHQDITGVILPDSLEEIGSEAFASCHITTVDLPSNIKYIGYGAFCNSDLAELHLPVSEEFDTIESYAFAGLPLKELVIPSNIKNICDNAFGDMRELETLIIEEGVETIGEGAFGICNSLSEVHIPKSVCYIGPGNFNSDWIFDILTSVRVDLDCENTNFVLKDGILYTADLQSIVWFSDSVKEIVLPTGMTVVPSGYFSRRISLEKVTVPEGVTTIDWFAFENCTNLREVILPESLKSIERGAFRGCSSLEHIELPGNLEYIGWLSFEGTALKNITIPASVTQIEDNPFGNNIENIVVEEGNEHIRLSADGVLYGHANFDGEEELTVLHVLPYNIDTITIENGVKSIDQYKLNNLKAKRVILPETLEFLSTQSFQNCENLEYAYIPASLTDISNPYYSDNSFFWLFMGSSNLREIDVSPDNPVYASYDGILYNKDCTDMLLVPQKVKENVVIPEGIIQIKPFAFEGRNLFSVTLPESLEFIRERAFTNNPNLMQIRIPSKVTVIENDVFDSYQKGLLKVVNDSVLNFEFGSDSYGYIMKFTKIYIERGVEYHLIEDNWEYEGNWEYFEYNDYIYKEYLGEPYDVDCRYLIYAYLGDDTEITLPNEYNGEEVGWYKFQSGNATKVTIPDGTYKIHDHAFETSDRIESIVMPDTVKIIGDYAFSCCTFDGVYLPPRVIEIGECAFFGTKITEAVIPDGIITIGDGAFGGCKNLTKVVLPDTLRELSLGAFEGCENLTEIELPPYLEVIAAKAFKLTGLTSVTVPRTVRFIGKEAFLCENLASVTLPERSLLIDERAFGYTEYSFYLYWPSANTKLFEDESNWDGDFLYIGSHLIRYRGNDKFVTVEKDVLSMAKDAFEGCYNVECLEIGGNCVGGLTSRYLPSLKTLIVRNAPVHEIDKYFMRLPYNYKTDGCDYDEREDYINMEPRYEVDIPEGLKTLILRDTCLIEHRDELVNLNDIMIFVEGTKADSPWDRLAPGWHNDNIVTYGDKWYMAKFFDADGEIISLECFRNSQAIRPPYVVLPRSGDTEYKHVGWDINGDGEPDGLPASRLSDVEAHAVVTTSKPAYYYVKFMDIDRKTVLYQYTLQYGATITPPDTVKEIKGYTFTGWENYTEGMTVNTDTKIYSTWKHDGDGHNYVTTVIPPTCTERGYTLHKCIICDDEFKTDYVDETWHQFGDWIIDKDSTCSEHGDRHRVCEKCGFTENAIVDKKGHTYDRTVIKEATCTEQGIVSCVCSVCGAKTQEPISCIPHDYQKVIAEKSYIEWLDKEFSGIVWGHNEDKTEFWYYICSYCNRIQTAEIASVAGVGNNHRHEFSAILSGNGKAVAVRCSLCGEIQCHEHVYELSNENNGIITYTCVNCSDSYTEQITYVVSFVDWDNTLITEKTYHYGDAVTVPDNPERSADETYTYSFNGWDKEVKAVSGNETYTATYKVTPIEYTVTFKNYDGSVIKTTNYHYGDTVTVPADPQRAADNTYTFSFNGWDKEITAVNGNAEYTATYTTTYIDYTVRFIDYNDTVISERTYHYSDTVIVPDNPSREKDGEYTYTFSGWDKDITLCDGDKTYRATYTTDENVYTVTFKNYDGSVIAVQTYNYGNTVKAPANPERAADNTYTYTFDGWDKEIKAVTENAEYTATYKATYIDYTVKFIDYNGSVLSEKTYHYGDEVTVPDDPEREEDEKYTYSFSGWDKEITEVKGNETYTATYEATEKPQTQFVPGDINGDGSVNNKDVVALFKYVSGGEIAVNDIALDINGDGSVNNKDVVALFKYVSGGDIQLSDKPYDPNAKAMMFAIVPRRIRVY